MLSNLCRLASRIDPVNHSKYAFYQVRYAGHAKWQNIKGTKLANDAARSKLISRYVGLVKKAVIAGGYIGDPKLNGKLATVLAEAQKLSLPKATLERSIERALNIKVIPVNIFIQGPGGSAIIARCETENISNMRRELKKVCKKFDASVLPDESLMNMFRSKGIIRASTVMSTSDQREISQDYAEESAIMTNAEEVYLERIEGDESTKSWVFTTDAINLDPCKSSLEKLGFKITSSELELVPYREIDFGEDLYDKIEELIQVLRSIDQVVEVYHNAAAPAQNNT